MRFDTILFDLDGTLIDSVELILSSYRHTYKMYEGQIPTDEFLIASLGKTLLHQFSVPGRSTEEVDAMIDTYREHNQQHHDQSVRPYPGVKNSLLLLKQAGIQMGIVTNKNTETAIRGLSVCGIDSFFSTVVGTDDVIRHKPHPEPVRTAIERLGDRPTESVALIGDSPHDIAAGKAAGVVTIAVLWGPFPRSELEKERPDHFLSTPSELGQFAGHFEEGRGGQA